MPNKKESLLFQHGPFRTILDSRARPHYIMLADSSLEVLPVPSKEFSYHGAWVRALVEGLRLLGPETTISIHLGFYRTRKHFHLHYVALDRDRFREHWIRSRGYAGVATLDTWEESNKKKSQQYQRNDIAGLCKTRAGAGIQSAVKSANASFQSDAPILSIPSTESLEGMLATLHSLARKLGIDRKNRGGHICVRPTDSKMTQFMGWLLVDVTTYYSIHPEPEKWLLNFAANEEFEIWT